MKRRRFFKFLLLFLIFAPIFFFVGGEIVQHLYNWLAAALFGLHAITFWQAVGLLILCRILFGGFGGGHRHRSDWRHRMQERFDKMTPEEREAMRRKWCGVAGTPGAPATEPRA